MGASPNPPAFVAAIKRQITKAGVVLRIMARLRWQEFNSERVTNSQKNAVNAGGLKLIERHRLNEGLINLMADFTATTARIHIAKHVWATFMLHRPKEATSLALMSPGKAAVNTWFQKHGDIFVEGETKQSLLQALIQDKTFKGHRSVISGLCELERALSANEISNFLTMNAGLSEILIVNKAGIESNNATGESSSTSSGGAVDAKEEAPTQETRGGTLMTIEQAHRLDMKKMEDKLGIEKEVIEEELRIKYEELEAFHRTQLKEVKTNLSAEMRELKETKSQKEVSHERTIRRVKQRNALNNISRSGFSSKH